MALGIDNCRVPAEPRAENEKLDRITGATRKKTVTRTDPRHRCLANHLVSGFLVLQLYKALGLGQRN